MAVTAMEPYASPRNAHQMGTEAEFAAQHPFLHEQQDRRVFLGFALKLLLYQPPASLVRPAAVNRIGRMNSAFPASRSEVPPIYATCMAISGPLAVMHVRIHDVMM